MVIRGCLAAKEDPEEIRRVDLPGTARLVGELIGNWLPPTIRARAALPSPTRGPLSPTTKATANSLISIDSHAEGADGDCVQSEHSDIAKVTSNELKI